VLTAANSDYRVGSFDGVKFVPETPMLKGHRGRGFYAARHSAICRKGWPAHPDRLAASAESRDAFQSGHERALISKLVSHFGRPPVDVAAGHGAGLSAQEDHQSRVHEANPGDANPLAETAGALLDTVAVLEPGKATEVRFSVRGVPVVYDVPKEELIVNGHRAAAPLRQGRLDLRILVDRTALEVFASNGECYVPMPRNPESGQPRDCRQRARGHGGFFHASCARIEVHLVIVGGSPEFAQRATRSDYSK